jgi:cyclase
VRRLCLIALALLLLPRLAFAQQSDSLKFVKVSGNIYMLGGLGGNIAASVGDDGILIVDDQFAQLADKIQGALKNLGLTNKPVRFVINTHYHLDHTSANSQFATAGSILIAHENVRKRLESGSDGGNGDSVKYQTPPQPRSALPIITFEDSITLHFNGDDIRVVHFPPSHTDGDSAVFFPTNNVVHTGDEFVRYGFPSIDLVAGGNVQGMIAACEKLVAMLPPDVKVIPGHGALSNLDDVRAFTQMLKETLAAVQKALDEHKTLEQMKQEKILAPWAKWSNGVISADAFTETLYNSLGGAKGHSAGHN